MPSHLAAPLRGLYTRLAPRFMAYTFNENAMAALLELIPAIRNGVKYPNGTNKSERHFLDFVINGESLWEKVGKQHDMVSALCLDYDTDETKKVVDRLLLTEKADLPNNRRSLFICSECGELGCGAITVVVLKERDTFTWMDLGYENSYENVVSLEDYKSVGPFTFSAAEYEDSLRQALERLRGAASWPCHRSREGSSNQLRYKAHGTI